MKRAALYARIAALAVVMCAMESCRLPTDQVPGDKGRLVVQAVLDPHAREQSVILGRVWTGHTGTNVVPNATVTLTMPDGSIIRADTYAPEDRYNGAYSEFALGGGILNPLPEGRYVLSVRTTEGEEVVGATTMPARMMLDSSAIADFDRTRDTVLLAWPRTEGARAYELRTMCVGGLENGYGYIYSKYSRFVRDTAFALSGLQRTINNDKVFYPGCRVTLTVIAVDENYYDYYRVQSDPFAGAPPSRLTGGEGVFGSIMPLVKRTIQVRR